MTPLADAALTIVVTGALVLVWAVLGHAAWQAHRAGMARVRAAQHRLPAGSRPRPRQRREGGSASQSDRHARPWWKP